MGHSRTRPMRLVMVASCSVALAAATAGSASGAGSGYGGATQPPSSQPTGFRAIIVVRTIGRSGGVVNGEAPGGPVEVVVPKLAYRRSFQVAITKGSAATVKRDLIRSLARRRVLAVLGIELRSGTSSITTAKKVTVIFTDVAIWRGCIVAVYNPRSGKFMRAAATVRREQVRIRMRSGESIAILAPATR